MEMSHKDKNKVETQRLNKVQEKQSTNQMRNKKPKSEHTSGETLGDTGKDMTWEDRVAERA